MAVRWSLKNSGRATGLKFKKLMGESPLRYLAVLRAQRAIELLETTDQSLDQIASTVGYSDGFSFSKMFKNITGESPRDFKRKSHEDKFNPERIK